MILISNLKKCCDVAKERNQVYIAVSSMNLTAFLAVQLYLSKSLSVTGLLIWQRARAK